LIQSNQKSSHQKCFFAAQGLCRTIRKNSGGWNLFAGLPYRFSTRHAKSSYALTHFTGLLFSRIFPEAFLLTGGFIIAGAFLVCWGADKKKGAAEAAP